MILFLYDLHFKKDPDEYVEDWPGDKGRLAAGTSTEGWN